MGKYQTFGGHIIDEKEIRGVRMYDANKNVEIKKTEKREGGIEVDDEVVSITDGTLGQFIKDWDSFNTNGKANKEQPCIKVVCSNGANKIVSVKADGQYHEKSTMASWVKTYKKPPFVGQKVKTVTNDNGFFEVILRK